MIYQIKRRNDLLWEGLKVSVPGRAVNNIDAYELWAVSPVWWVGGSLDYSYVDCFLHDVGISAHIVQRLHRLPTILSSSLETAIPTQPSAQTNKDRMFTIFVRNFGTRSGRSRETVLGLGNNWH
ncbi:hypothetical protein TNCV_2510011 [Trichonephila clavipes]|nr:hypothetical protein TNCV_2510011 [Trichonephila clavipes]